MDLHLSLSSIIDQHHSAHLQLTPWAVYLYALGLTPNTGLHCHAPVVRTSSHGGACQQPRPPELPGCLQLASTLTLVPTTISVFVTGSDTMQAPTATPAAEHVYTTGSGYHHCLPWSLAVGTGGACEDLNSLRSLCRLPAVLTKDHTVVDHAKDWWPEK